MNPSNPCWKPALNLLHGRLTQIKQQNRAIKKRNKHIHRLKLELTQAKKMTLLSGEDLYDVSRTIWKIGFKSGVEFCEINKESDALRNFNAGMIKAADLAYNHRNKFASDSALEAFRLAIMNEIEVMND